MLAEGDSSKAKRLTQEKTYNIINILQ
jgi:hypothetical protein